MASVSVPDLNRYKILNRFQVFINQLAQELVILEVKIIKSLLTGVVSQTVIDQIDTEKSRADSCAVDLFSVLQRYRKISSNNLDLLKELLIAIANFALLDKVEEFEKTVTTLDDATPAQMEVIQQVADIVKLFLVLDREKQSLSNRHIDLLKEKIKKASGLKLAQLQYISSKENVRDRNSTVVEFQFDDSQGMIARLHESATNKEPWLKDSGVILLKVNGNASVNIREPLEFEPNISQEEGVLDIEMKPELQPHARDVVDVILVVEMPHSVVPISCKQVLDQCQFAIKGLAESHGNELDMQLAVVQFGNGKCSLTSTDPAFIIQDFCTDFFDVKNKLKDKGRCGLKEGGHSGMGAALAKVLELSRNGSMRKEASKVCVMTSFLPKEQDLNHFKCPDNDIINLSQELAEVEIPLYVLGVHEKEIGNQSGNNDVEKYFLPGVAHIGGGRYFTIQKRQIQCLNEVITAIVRNDVSIENFGETTAEVFKDALNNNFGDANINRLSKDLDQDLRFKPLKEIKKLRNDGQLLQPVHHIAERVALADDVGDAIEAIKRFYENKTNIESRLRGAPQCRLLLDKSLLKGGIFGKDPKQQIEEQLLEEEEEEEKVKAKQGKAAVPHKADVAKMCQNVQEQLSPQQLNHLADLEMAGRIVRRYFYRMAYYNKKP